jgi:hypothetical protein
MDNFFRRLKYYGIGFGIGMLFVFFFFKNKGCSWTPSNRVKSAIFERIIVLSETEQKKLSEMQISNKELLQILRDGDIDFQKSEKSSRFKVYHINCTSKTGKNFTAKITLGEDSFISEIQFNNTKSSKIRYSEKGYGKFIYFPKPKDLIYVDTTDLLICQQEALKIQDNNKLYQQIIKTGKIDFSKSKLYLNPKPEHFLTFKDKKNRKIAAKGIWYMDKIEIVQLFLDFKNDCK